MCIPIPWKTMKCRTGENPSSSIKFNECRCRLSCPGPADVGPFCRGEANDYARSWVWAIWSMSGAVRARGWGGLRSWLCQNSYWKWPNRNSGFSHEKWWCSIVMWQLTRGLGGLRSWEPAALAALQIRDVKISLAPSKTVPPRGHEPWRSKHGENIPSHTRPFWQIHGRRKSCKVWTSPKSRILHHLAPVTACNSMSILLCLKNPALKIYLCLNLEEMCFTHSKQNNVLDSC